MWAARFIKNVIPHVALAGIFLAIGVNLCFAQTASPDVSGAAQARAFFANKTYMTSYSGHGTQVEYLRSGGAAFLWYPGNTIVVRGNWKVEVRDAGALICFRYGRNTYNPVTRKRGGQWECMGTARQASLIVESARADVFGLAKGSAVPFVLSRERATIQELKARLERR